MIPISYRHIALAVGFFFLIITRWDHYFYIKVIVVLELLLSSAPCSCRLLAINRKVFFFFVFCVGGKKHISVQCIIVITNQ